MDDVAMCFLDSFGVAILVCSSEILTLSEWGKAFNLDCLAAIFTTTRSPPCLPTCSMDRWRWQQARNCLIDWSSFNWSLISFQKPQLEFDHVHCAKCVFQRQWRHQRHVCFPMSALRQRICLHDLLSS